MKASAILLVDDDPDACALMSDFISDLGYRVDVAHGQAGMQQVLSRQPPSARSNEGSDEATRLEMPTMSRYSESSEGWFYKRDGESVGPVSRLQLKELVTSGQVQPRQAVWQQSTEDQFIVWAATVAFGTESKAWLWTRGTISDDGGRETEEEVGLQVRHLPQTSQ